MRTLLFDIDGTLLRTNRGGIGAIRLALQSEFGLSQPAVDIPFCGRTDRQILHELLVLNNVDPSDANRQRLQACYASMLPEVLNQHGGQVLPGVGRLLELLADDSRVCVGVMTGNLLTTATSKLHHFGLLRYVRWIVGGDSDSHRDDLARRAQQFIRRHLGDNGDVDNGVVVIGDTPADVRCGRAIGAETVAVCTGQYRAESLLIEKPDWLFEDLSDVPHVQSALLGTV